MSIRSRLGHLLGSVTAHLILGGNADVLTLAHEFPITYEEARRLIERHGSLIAARRTVRNNLQHGRAAHTLQVEAHGVFEPSTLLREDEKTYAFRYTEVDGDETRFKVMMSGPGAEILATHYTYATHRTVPGMLYLARQKPQWVRLTTMVRRFGAKDTWAVWFEKAEQHHLKREEKPSGAPEAAKPEAEKGAVLLEARFTLEASPNPDEIGRETMFHVTPSVGVINAADPAVTLIVPSTHIREAGALLPRPGLSTAEKRRTWGLLTLSDGRVWSRVAVDGVFACADGWRVVFAQLERVEPAPITAIVQESTKRTLTTLPTLPVMPPAEAARFLRDTGLLFEANRRVFHPLGLALAWDGAGHFLGIVDGRRDGEGIVFAPEEFTAGSRKFATYVEQRGRKVRQTRRKALGFVEQVKAHPRATTKPAPSPPRTLAWPIREFVERLSAYVEIVELRFNEQARVIEYRVQDPRVRQRTRHGDAGGAPPAHSPITHYTAGSGTRCGRWEVGEGRTAALSHVTCPGCRAHVRKTVDEALNAATSPPAGTAPQTRPPTDDASQAVQAPGLVATPPANGAERALRFDRMTVVSAGGAVLGTMTEVEVKGIGRLWPPRAHVVTGTLVLTEGGIERVRAGETVRVASEGAKIALNCVVVEYASASLSGAYGTLTLVALPSGEDGVEATPAP